MGEIGMKEKILAAMNGDIYSAVAAKRLLESGASVLGVTLDLFGGSEFFYRTNMTNAALGHMRDAKDMANGMRMDHIIINCHKEFEQTVIDPLIPLYCRDFAPSPCVICGRKIIFGLLMNVMNILGYDKLATGHFARVEKSGDRYILKKAKELRYDQTHLLYMLTQDKLAHCAFPLGYLSSEEIMNTALENGFFEISRKSEHRFCFASGDDCAYYFKNFEKRKAFLEDPDYSVFPRDLLPTPETRLRAADIFPEVTGELSVSSVFAENINFIPFDTLSSPMSVNVKFGSGCVYFPAIAEQTAEDEFHLEFFSLLPKLKKGQSVILYDGEIVIGGGTVK